MAKNWTNRKIKYYVTIKQFVDIETGELITEEEYKQQYKTIKNERTKKYGYDRCVTTKTAVGRKTAKQLNIW